MTFVVTGSEGFIGKYLCQFLIDRGYEVEGWDIKNGKNAFDLKKEDLRDKIVIHLAGISGVRDGGDFSLNWKLTKYLDNISEKMLWASSSNAAEPTANEYALSKYKGEQETASSVAMRFSTVYGPNPREDMLFGLIKNNKLEYSTNHIRDFVHVDDVCEAILLMVMKYEFFVNRVVDVSTGTGVVVSQVVDFLCVPVPVKEMPDEVNSNVMIPFALFAHKWIPKKNFFEEIIKIV